MAMERSHTAFIRFLIFVAFHESCFSSIVSHKHILRLFTPLPDSVPRKAYLPRRCFMVSARFQASRLGVHLFSLLQKISTTSLHMKDQRHPPAVSPFFLQLLCCTISRFMTYHFSSPLASCARFSCLILALQETTAFNFVFTFFTE